MPAPNFSEPLAWSDSPLENPLAIYDVDFATALTFNWTELRGYFGKVELRPKWVCIDNLDSDQFLNAYFDNVRYPVNAFQRLTVPVPPNARGFQLIGDASSLLTCEVIFAIDDISKADTINFKQIQNSGTEGVLWPLFNQSGPKNFIGSDDHTIHKFIITGATAVNLPDPLTVSNGWVIQVWNDGTSTANITLAVTGGADIDGNASLTIAPGDKYWFVEDGANAFTVIDANVVNPQLRVYTAGATWTPTFSVGLDYITVDVIGGGGSGGAVPTGVAGQSRYAAGGGGGGRAIKKILAAALNLAGETVTVGAGAAAPAAGANPGTTGGTSSFGAHCSATGGTGGASMADGAAAATSAGGTGGSGVGGDINIDGGNGTRGIRTGTTFGWSGHGGDALGGISGSTTSVNPGDTGNNYGGGGGGASSFANGAAQAGGAGANGIVIVTEYYK